MIEIVQRRDPQSGKVRTSEADLDKKSVVRVLPRDEDIRRVMRHGVTRVGFPTSGGSAEWPNDTFTKRRIKDGDVTVEEAPPPPEAKTLPPPENSGGARAQQQPAKEPPPAKND